MPHTDDDGDGQGNEESLDAPYYVPVAGDQSSDEYISEERRRRLHDQHTDHSQDRDPTRIGNVEFEYEQPDVSVDTGARTAQHKILDGTTVIQRLGRKPDKITVKGVCWPEEANQIDRLANHETVTMRSERWSGTAMVIDTGTDPMRAKDADGKWLYKYTIQLTEAGSGRFERVDSSDVEYDGTHPSLDDPDEDYISGV